MLRQINKALNLVVPIETATGTAFAYSTPIEEETFEKYYRVIGKVFSTLYEDGLRPTAVPTAYLTLRDISQRLGVWEGEEGVERGLVGEMDRLTVVHVPSAGGFEPLPLAEAEKQKIVDRHTLREVRNVVTFFTVLYNMHLRAEREPILTGICGIWEGQITSSDFTEWHVSYLRSTQKGNTGEKDSEKKDPPAAAPSTSSVVA